MVLMVSLVWALTLTYGLVSLTQIRKQPLTRLLLPESHLSPTASSKRQLLPTSPSVLPTLLLTLALRFC